MSIPRLTRQWDIYKANLGEGEDALVLVLSSSETNAIVESTFVVCEVVPENLYKLKLSPLSIGVKSTESGLEWPAAISLVTLTAMPRNCLVSLEGRLEPVTIRNAILKGLSTIFGLEPWPS